MKNLEKELKKIVKNNEINEEKIAKIESEKAELEAKIEELTQKWEESL